MRRGAGPIPSFSGFTPGNLVVSRSVYTGTAATVTVGQPLPPNCPATASCGTGTATDKGAFPAVGSTNNVWNNDKVDGSFGVTSPLFLDQITTTGTLVSTLAVPTTLVTTSFSSKSEVALNLSLDAKYLTFMAYQAPPNAVDVSNSNTPGAVDPTNPVGANVYRAVVQVDGTGAFQATSTNSYSGNNGRAAILANGLYYMSGNSNNGSGTPANITSTAGMQLAVPGQAPSTAAIEIGNFSVTQYNDPATGKPYAADKAGKDNNFRGLTIFNNTLYATKGSGSNGINTVYQVGNAGSLPTAANAASAPITILPGLPTVLAKNAAASNPFGIWFANATTLYVADEGDGTAADAATSTNAGLEKWILVNGTWQLAYVLQNGLNLGQQYSVANYPTALNPATDGLRNITGRVNGDGTVTVWGVTSTISANGDQGADPNKLVAITDVLANTTAAGAGNEVFTTIRSAGYGEVLRGVSFTPGTVAPLYISTTSPLAQGTAGVGPGADCRSREWKRDSQSNQRKHRHGSASADRFSERQHLLSAVRQYGRSGYPSDPGQRQHGGGKHRDRAARRRREPVANGRAVWRQLTASSVHGTRHVRPRNQLPSDQEPARDAGVRWPRRAWGAGPAIDGGWRIQCDHRDREVGPGSGI